MEQQETCERCEKVPALCVCQEIIPQSTYLKILILQHPQEPDHDLGTARLASLALPKSTLKIGLSWRNLNAALGEADAVSNRWAVLYLGSGIKGETLSSHPIQFVSQKGNPVDRPEGLEGIVVLDGSWSQAKALWWRNPWLLKLKRVILQPVQPSLYKELRREPRKECLSTIESIATILTAFGEKSEIEVHLKTLFGHLLSRYRNK